MLASSSFDGSVQVWDTSTGVILHTLDHWPADASCCTWTVSSVAFGPGGRTLASADAKGVYLWDAVAGTLQHTLEGGHPGGVTGLAFSPDGRTLASGGGDGTILLWDVVSGSTAGPFVANLEGAGKSGVAAHR